jgi:hypothetical protein
MPTDRRADHATYARVFEGHHEGALILEDLTRRFGGALFVKGGEDNLGRRAVLDFIIGMVNQANNVDPPDEQDPQPAG